MSFFARHISLFLCASLLLIFCGCTREDVEHNPPDPTAPARSVSAPPATLPEGSITVSAQSAVLLDATDGGRNVLWEQNADRRLGMASTTKIMTALIALETLPLSSVVQIPRDAVGIEGSSLYLTEGEELTAEELLYGLLLQSANDAAAALAITVGGTPEGFAVLMNEKAAELGLEDTHFSNPHGLDDEEHYTTARELAILTAAALENPQFYRIVSTYRYEISGPDGTGKRLLINHNRLLRSYEGCVGVKTGFTKATGRCLVSAAERGGIRLIAVTLNDGDDWNDHAEMFDAGFSALELALLDDFCVLPELAVTGGEQSFVRCAPSESLRAVLARGHGEITCKIEMPHLAYAPIRAGDVVGHLSFFCDGQQIGACEIIAQYSVAGKHPKHSIFGKIIGH